MGQARRAEADLRELQAIAFLHQHVARGDFEPLEGDLAMPAMLLRPHDRDAADDVPAGAVAVEQEGGEALARIVGRPRHEDEVCGILGAGDEPLAAGDDVGVSPPLGAGLDHAGSDPPPG